MGEKLVNNTVTRQEIQSFVLTLENNFQADVVIRDGFKLPDSLVVDDVLFGVVYEKYEVIKLVLRDGKGKQSSTLFDDPDFSDYYLDGSYSKEEVFQLIEDAFNFAIANTYFTNQFLKTTLFNQTKILISKKDYTEEKYQDIIQKITGKHFEDIVLVEKEEVVHASTYVDPLLNASQTLVNGSSLERVEEKNNLFMRILFAFGEYFSEIGLLIFGLFKGIGLGIARYFVIRYFEGINLCKSFVNVFKKNPIPLYDYVHENRFLCYLKRIKKSDEEEGKSVFLIYGLIWLIFELIVRAITGLYYLFGKKEVKYSDTRIVRFFDQKRHPEDDETSKYKRKLYKEHHQGKKDNKYITLTICFYVSLAVLCVLFLIPFFIVIINSFKLKEQIVLNPLSWPTKLQWSNYTEGLNKVDFIPSLLKSLYVTVVSTGLILLTSSMASWMIVRVKNVFTKILYYCFLLAMVVPFQLVMKPMVYFTNNYYHITSIFTLPLVYVGFGAGLSVFMFVGFLKSIPYEIEEAACIDGCSPIKTFFRIIAPIMKPTYITVAILNVMWIWNDFLLPSVILEGGFETTLPIQIQKAFCGSYGSVDYNNMMAAILVSIIPVIVFYLALQKYIIKGVSDGAVKS